MTNRKIIADRYEIISEIKKGGFGTVYFGFDMYLRKPIAVKEINSSLLDEAKYIDMFQAEARYAAQLNHKNIVHVFDFQQTEDNNVFIIMEYIDGGDLGTALRNSKKFDQRVPVDVGVYIMAEVCKALDYAYTKNDSKTNEPLKLVHQDICPSNIMLSNHGVVKLIDFGIAGVKFKQMSKDKNSISVAGKLPYMSPEQLESGFVPSRNSDIFAVGAVFYELLTGERAFPQKQNNDLIEAIKKAKIDINVLKQEDIPEEVQKIILKCLEKNPTKRYTTADEVRQDIENYLKQKNSLHTQSFELTNWIRNLTFHSDVQNQTEQNNNEATVTPSKEKKITNEQNSQKESEIVFPQLTDTEVSNNIEMELESELQLLDSKDDSKNIEKQNNDVKVENQIENIDEQNNESEEISETEISEENTYNNVETIDETNDIVLPELGIGSGDLALPQQKNVDSEVGEVKESDQEEEELKTIIDVIRLSTRTHKKLVTRTLISIVFTFLLFTVTDTVFRWTNWGNSIYDFLFPPAIKIASIPEGAQISLNDEKLISVTPTSIPKIKPGIHKLTLHLAGYPDLVKSIRVPSKGSITVEGEKKQSSRSPYFFRFHSSINLLSNPPGATVYLNDIEYSDKTPCQVTWDVSVPLFVTMEKPNFETLSGISLDLLNEVEQIEDRRTWNFTKTVDKYKSYSVEGTFRKRISINTTPSGAQIFLNNEQNPIGITGYQGDILLTLGQHKLTLKRSGYLPATVTVNVEENGTNTINKVLYRRVQFFAKDVTDKSDNEIGAKIKQIIHQGHVIHKNSTTPCEMTLAPYHYEALFQKNGFKDAIVKITPNDRVVVARMEPETVQLSVKVIDALTGQPVISAQVRYRNLQDPSSNEEFFAMTDKNGNCIREIKPGRYSFKVKKFGYRDAIKSFVGGDNNTLSFRMVLL